MKYTPRESVAQLDLFSAEMRPEQFLLIPSALVGFCNTSTSRQMTHSQREVFCMHGLLEISESDRLCPVCGTPMHRNNKWEQTLRHLPFGSTLTQLMFSRAQFLCPSCGHTHMQDVPFKSEHHRITRELETYVCDLLASGNYTNKEIAQIAGLGPNTVKAIDLRRLQGLYTQGGKLVKPEHPVPCLGIDEFKLHNGYKFATHIIDMGTGHILWIAEGKKKQVVYDFIEHVGMEWMGHVKAVAMDMNSDFQEAFQDRCPHIRVVFDHFHIVKNFNEKVIAPIRKDEQKRLLEQGDEEAAKSLKGARYILASSRETLKSKDKEAQEGKILRKGSDLFQLAPVKRKAGHLERYEKLLQENQLLFTVDLIKEKLHAAYGCEEEHEMQTQIKEIMGLCEASGNEHLLWFRNLLDNHLDGVIAHATHRISSGKIEGINNKIKTLRRQAYGYPDDEYFFLKLFDMSRKGYVKNIPSHKICE